MLTPFHPQLWLGRQLGYDRESAWLRSPVPCHNPSPFSVPKPLQKQLQKPSKKASKKRRFWSSPGSQFSEPWAPPRGPGGLVPGPGPGGPDFRDFDTFWTPPGGAHFGRIPTGFCHCGGTQIRCPCRQGPLYGIDVALLPPPGLWTPWHPYYDSDVLRIGRPSFPLRGSSGDIHTRMSQGSATLRSGRMCPPCCVWDPSFNRG